ncbi:hypothetical protein FE257_012255 [Aspergillus nanangensis]|uniref:Uncharacterized protein n=1 Tax=Aspergillus nanangensis TaxID=2582783 RepID=A0AAD4CG52_ASPNN|nr:hypothetical protein FE257_012255 [Aspergillus nanangensis]
MYPAQASNPPQTYDSPMEIGENHNMMEYHNPTLWANPLDSNGAAYANLKPKIKKEDPDEPWEQMLIEPSNTAGASLQTQVLQTPDMQPPNEEKVNPADWDYIPDCSHNHRQDTQENHQSEVIIKWVQDQDKPSNKKRRKVLSASGLQCTICGILRLAVSGTPCVQRHRIKNKDSSKRPTGMRCPKAFISKINFHNNSIEETSRVLNIATAPTLVV